MQNRLRCSLFVLSVTFFANAKAVSAFPAPSGSLSATSAESALSLSDVQQEEVENWFDVFQLANDITKKVERFYNIKLENEVRFITTKGEIDLNNENVQF